MTIIKSTIRVRVIPLLREGRSGSVLPTPRQILTTRCFMENPRHSTTKVSLARAQFRLSTHAFSLFLFVCVFFLTFRAHLNSFPSLRQLFVVYALISRFANNRHRCRRLRDNGPCTECPVFSALFRNGERSVRNSETIFPLARIRRGRGDFRVAGDRGRRTPGRNRKGDL